MGFDEQGANELEKKKRIYENFIQDLGPLRKYVEDMSITDIKVIGTGEILYESFEKGKVFTGEYIKPEKARGIILSAASMLDKTIEYGSDFPKLECQIPKPYALRFTGLLPPAVDNPQIAMRRPAERVFSLEEYVEQGRLRQDEYDLICQYIKDRKNILVGGATGSGKTTFTNAVLKKMVEYTPNDAFYIVEDVQELQCTARDCTMINATKRSAAEAVRTALRWTPKRIIFGEVRYGEVAEELIKSWNTGHTGNVTTLHADSATSMLTRLESILSEVIVGKLPDLTQVIHLCVHLARGKNGPYIDQVLPVKERTKDFLERIKEEGV